MEGSNKYKQKLEDFYLRQFRETFSSEELLFLKLLYESVLTEKGYRSHEQKTEEKLIKLMKRLVAKGYFHSFANISRIKDNILAKSRKSLTANRYVC